MKPSRSFSEEDVKKVARGAGATLIGSALGKGIFFLSQVVISRLIGLEAFGLYSLGFAAVKICETLARLGLNTGGMRFVSIYKDTDHSRLKGTIITSLVVSMACGTGIGFLLYWFAPEIAGTIFHKPQLAGTLRLFGFAVPFCAAMMVMASLLQGFHVTKYTVYVRDLVQPLANIAFMVIFYGFMDGLSAVVLAFSVSHAVALIAGLFCFVRVFPGLKDPRLAAVYELRSLLRYSTPLLFVGFLSFFRAWTDTLMLGFLGTAQDAGIYRAASQVPFAMTVFLFATNSIYAPLAADLYAKGELKRLNQVFKTTTRWTAYTTIPLFIFLVFSAKELMMFFGREYVESGAAVLIILSFGQLVNCVTGGVGFTLTMTGKQTVELANSLALIVVGVLLNLWAIPRYGVMGAAVASSASMVIINILRVIQTYYLYSIAPYSKQLLKASFPALACMLLLPLCNVTGHYLLIALLKASVVLVLFGIGFAIIPMDEEDRFLLEKMKKKLGFNKRVSCELS